MNAILRLIFLIVFAVSSVSILSGCGKAEYERRLDASVKKYSAMKQPKDEDDYDDYDDYDSGEPADEPKDDEEADEEPADDEESDDAESPFNNEVE